MAVTAGSNVVLKVGAATVGEMQSVTWAFAGGMADVTTQSSSGVLTLLAGTGIKSFEISGEMVYDVADTTGVIALRSAHLSRSLIACSLTDGTETIAASFEVVDISLSADQIGTGAAMVSITLKASGAVTIT